MVGLAAAGLPACGTPPGTPPGVAAGVAVSGVGCGVGRWSGPACGGAVAVAPRPAVFRRGAEVAELSVVVGVPLAGSA
ncbi:hypothetical protein ASE03_15255 [Kitasatospora sp. Root187]|nr:hypothetical protein ASE03_15255 [Kitasatospora sp. Root187]